MISLVKQANEQLTENQWHPGEPYPVRLGVGRPDALRLDPPAPYRSAGERRPALKNAGAPPSLAPTVSHKAGFSKTGSGPGGRAGSGSWSAGRGLRVTRVRA